MTQSIEEGIAIEEILTEASGFNLRNEVIKNAQKNIGTFKNRAFLTTLEAYQMAYKKQIK